MSCMLFNYAKDTSMLCIYNEYDCVYKDLQSVTGTMNDILVRNELHASKSPTVSIRYF